MITTSMLLGNGAYANVEDNVLCKIWSIANNADIEWNGNVPSGEGARVEENNVVYPYLRGYIAGALLSADNTGIVSLPPETYAYFFYAGTAPSPTKITFTMRPIITNDYITSPFNSHSSSINPYNTITIQSIHK